jgi:DNA-binding transcriptional LysR family regulator
MELRHLRYFIAVAEELNFSRAAQRLHVSQPPLSRQIQDLEAELGVKLLERDRQGVQLTRVGKSVLAKARRLVEHAELLGTDARQLAQQSQRELQVGYAPAPSSAIIALILRRYHELAPAAPLTLHDLSLNEILVGLKTRKLDLGLSLRPKAGEMRGLKFEPLRRYSVGIICARSSSWAALKSMGPADLPMKKLVGYRAVDFPEYHSWVAGILGVNKSRVHFVRQCDGVLSIIATVESGAGPAVVGEFTKSLAADRVRYVPFVSKAAYMDVGLLYRRGGLHENLKKLIAASLESRTKPLPS